MNYIDCKYTLEGMIETGIQMSKVSEIKFFVPNKAIDFGSFLEEFGPKAARFKSKVSLITTRELDL
jgi:hypothetical protein